jgi:hypothetical protein
MNRGKRRFKSFYESQMPIGEQVDIPSRRQRNYEKFQRGRKFYETKNCVFNLKIKKYATNSTTRQLSLSKSITSKNKQDLN